MSRGFIKEGDQEEVPMVPRRAYLPEGVPNFVTPAGLEQLLAEREALVAEKEAVTITHENEKRIALNFINAKLQLLNSRINDARVVEQKEQPGDEITFGASVTLKNVKSGMTRTFQIVGVDEADISKGKISFVSPLAKALINRKTGERINLKSDGEVIVFEILEIAWL